jgi:predicted Holliday junction resolvase-like endonuclease
MNPERNSLASLPVGFPDADSNFNLAGLGNGKNGVFNNVKLKILSLQREYTKQQESNIFALMEQFEREYNSIGDERKLVQEKERLLEEKARENDQVEEDLRTRESTLQKNKEILLQHVQGYH